MNVTDARQALIAAGLDPYQADRYDTALWDLVANRGVDMQTAVTRIRATIGGQQLGAAVATYQAQGLTQAQAIALATEGGQLNHMSYAPGGSLHRPATQTAPLATPPAGAEASSAPLTDPGLVRAGLIGGAILLVLLLFRR